MGGAQYILKINAISKCQVGEQTWVVLAFVAISYVTNVTSMQYYHIGRYNIFSIKYEMFYQD